MYVNICRNTRKNRISDIRWKIGSISIPSQISTNLNADEKLFFNEYCDNLSEYMSKVGLDVSAVYVNWFNYYSRIFNLPRMFILV